MEALSWEKLWNCPFSHSFFSMATSTVQHQFRIITHEAIQLPSHNAIYLVLIFFFLFPLIISIIFQTYTLLFFPLCTCALATCLLAFCYFLIQESYGTCFTNDIYKHIYNPSINDSSRSIQVSGSGNVANEKQPSMRLYHHHQLTSPVLSWNFSAKDSIFS